MSSSSSSTASSSASKLSEPLYISAIPTASTSSLSSLVASSPLNEIQTNCLYFRQGYLIVKFIAKDTSLFLRAKNPLKIGSIIAGCEIFELSWLEINHQIECYLAIKGVAMIDEETIHSLYEEFRKCYSIVLPQLCAEAVTKDFTRLLNTDFQQYILNGYSIRYLNDFYYNHWQERLYLRFDSNITKDTLSLLQKLISELSYSGYSVAMNIGNPITRSDTSIYTLSMNITKDNWQTVREKVLEYFQMQPVQLPMYFEALIYEDLRYWNYNPNTQTLTICIANDLSTVTMLANRLNTPPKSEFTISTQNNGMIEVSIRNVNESNYEHYEQLAPTIIPCWQVINTILKEENWVREKAIHQMFTDFLPSPLSDYSKSAVLSLSSNLIELQISRFKRSMKQKVTNTAFKMEALNTAARAFLTSFLLSYQGCTPPKQKDCISGNNFFGLNTLFFAEYSFEHVKGHIQYMIEDSIFSIDPTRQLFFHPCINGNRLALIIQIISSLNEVKLLTSQKKIGSDDKSYSVIKSYFFPTLDKFFTLKCTIDDISATISLPNKQLENASYGELAIDISPDLCSHSSPNTSQSISQIIAVLRATFYPANLSEAENKKLAAQLNSVSNRISADREQLLSTLVSTCGSSSSIAHSCSSTSVIPTPSPSLRLS